MTTPPKIPGTAVPDTSKPEAASRLPAWSTWVAVTTAMLAALAAISALYSNSHASQAMIDQIEASDQWNFYQAKGVKAAVLQSKLELLPALGKEPSPDDVQRTQRYKTEQEEIMAQAKAKQASAEDHRQRHDTMSKAGAAFQIAIAMAAISLLVKKNWFWFISIAVGVVGVVVLVRGFLPH